MYCANCGFKLDDDAKFCKNCGVEILEDVTHTETTFQEPNTNIAYSQPVTKQKKKGGLSIVLLLAGIALVGIIGLFVVRQFSGTGMNTGQDVLACTFHYEDEEESSDESILITYEGNKAIRIDDHIVQVIYGYEADEDEIEYAENYLASQLEGLDEYDGVDYSIKVQNSGEDVNIYIDYEIDVDKVGEEDIDYVLMHLDYYFSKDFNQLTKEELRKDLEEYDFTCQ